MQPRPAGGQDLHRRTRARRQISSAAAARRCSQLSRTSRGCWAEADNGVGEGRSAGLETPSASATWCDQPGIGQRREIDKDHAIGEVRSHVVGHGHSQPRLAHAAGTGQGQERHRLVKRERLQRRDRSGSRPMRRVRGSRQRCQHESAEADQAMVNAPTNQETDAAHSVRDSDYSGISPKSVVGPIMGPTATLRRWNRDACSIRRSVGQDLPRILSGGTGPAGPSSAPSDQVSL